MSTQFVPPSLDGTTPTADGARPGERGTVARVTGSIVGIRGLQRARLYDVVLVGPGRLSGEIIRLTGDETVA
jgi:hypothetical protein